MLISTACLLLIKSILLLNIIALLNLYRVAYGTDRHYDITILGRQKKDNMGKDTLM